MKNYNQHERKRKKTKTSNFGTAGRISHDSSKFYKSKLYQEIQKEKKDIMYIENTIEEKFLDTIFCKSSESMDELPDNSIHLMVTSPPYNVGKDYDNNLSLTEYRKFLQTVFKEVYRVLVPGGRACINIANLGRKPYIPLHSYIIQDMLEIGFLMRGEIIWDKGTSASPSTAWGTWMKATNPVLRDVHEYILVFSKDCFSRENHKNKKSTISREEFLEFTKSIWHFPAQRAKAIGHPAPFPVELPYRLIQLYTFEGDIVLDPFVGSGSTCIAALQTKRRYIAYEVEEKFCQLAQERINNHLYSQPTLL